MPAPVSEGAVPSLVRRALPVLAILLGLSVSIDTDSLFPLVRGAETAAGIVQRSVEYARQVAANDALETEVQFLATWAGGKWAVYRYLGLVERGQQVGRLVESPAPPPPVASPQERLRQWIIGTEEYGAQLVRGVGEIAACYGGLRPLDQPPDRRNSTAAPLSNEARPGITGRAGATASPAAAP